MTRILLALAGVVLLAVTALGLIWLFGQVLLGVGALAVGTAGVLLRLLWFFVVTGLLGGVAYFVANAWRPGLRSVVGQKPAAQAQRRAEPQAEVAQVTVVSVNPGAQVARE